MIRCRIDRAPGLAAFGDNSAASGLGCYSVGNLSVSAPGADIPMDENRGLQPAHPKVEDTSGGRGEAVRLFAIQLRKIESVWPTMGMGPKISVAEGCPGLTRVVSTNL